MIRIKQSFSNLSSAVSQLANSIKIYDLSRAVFFQLNLPEIHGKKDNSGAFSTFSGVWNPLTRLLPNGVL